ncbi:DUF2169 family type VI secretion system accessory protein [Eionea flava]
MQIIKSNRLGLIHKTYHLHHHRFAVGALAFFSLQKNTQHPLIEYDQWPRVMGQLPEGQALDIGYVKPRGEALVCANGYFHQHGLFYRSSPCLEVGGLELGELGIGGIKKSVRLPHFSRFKQSQKNPLNQFMPLDVLDKQRSRYNGTYDKKWLDTVHPGLPTDTDERLFNTASKDQQLKKGLLTTPYFSPNTAYRLTDMHADKACIEGHIPNIRVRAFAQLNESSNKDITEIDTVLETLWFFPEVDIGVAIFRGEIAVQDSDGLDVNALLLAYESADDSPRSIDYYQNVLSLRTDMKTAMAHVFNESQLMPEKTEEEKQALAQLVTQSEKEEKVAVDKMRQQILQQAEEIVQKKLPIGAPGQQEASDALAVHQSKSADGSIQALSAQAPSSQNSPYDIPTIPSAVLASGDFDLTDMLAATDQLQVTLEQEMAEKQAELETLAGGYQEQYADQPANHTAATEETVDDVKLRLLTPVYVMATDLKEKQQAAATKTIGDIIQDLPEAAKQQLDNADELDPNTLAQAYDKLLVMQRQARQSAVQSTPLKLLSSDVQQQAKVWVLELISTGESLAGRDLSHLDLSGVDFSGLDLRDVMFENAILDHCLFVNANMAGAVFAGAQLHHANLSDAVLNNTNFSQAKGEATQFTRAILDNSTLTESHFTGADFSFTQADNIVATTAVFTHSLFTAAVISKSLFNDTDFSHSQWKEAVLKESIFMQANLQQSHWVSADLQKCIFVDAQGQGANFSRALLDKVQFSSEATLASANFSEAHCTSCGFRNVNLKHLCARRAVFIECDFGDAKLHKSDLAQVIIKRSLMSMAQLDSAHCRDALFNEAVMRKVNLENSDIVGATFFNCTLEDNILQHTLTRNINVNPQASLK